MTIDLYDIIIAPMITEKATILAEQGKYIFRVTDVATKTRIKKNIEKLYSVKVDKVNIINLKPKAKRFRGVKGMRNGIRKAIVTLQQGQSIDLTAGA